MYIKTITFTDYDGEKHTEDFYFNLNKAEVLQMQLSQQGGLAYYVREIIKAKDYNTLTELWKGIILKSYGVKSPDGRRFIKTEELAKEFEQTEAYAELFTELALDAKSAAEFLNNIVPSDYSVDLSGVDFTDPEKAITQLESANKT